MNRVFIANFGRGNYAWDRCREMPSVATMNDEDTHHFWLDGDREAFIHYLTEKQKKAGEKLSPKQTMSRWFNLMTIVSQSSDDLWVHRDGDDIWWTISSGLPAIMDQQPRRVPYQDNGVYECHKPCQPWSNISVTGKPLRWKDVSLDMQSLLNVQGTFQEKKGYRKDAVWSLIVDGPIPPKRKPEIKTDSVGSDRDEIASTDDALEKSIRFMAYQAAKTAASSNGQTVTKTQKNKNYCFDDSGELEQHISEMLKQQNNKCNLTGIPLQFLGSATDEWMLCSLDRIDSDGHYERDNLQIVCRFINRWKSDMDNNVFVRLLDTLRAKTN